jgi:hypothetical protein
MSDSLADSYYYYQSGLRIFKGQNPYLGDLPFFSGPAGGWFLYLVGNIFFIKEFPIVWQIINLLGMSIFFFTMLSKLGVKHNLILLVAIMLLSSPVREMVVNNQVTGFVLGIAAFVIQTRSGNLNNIALMANSILMYLAFELKPNLVLGFVVYFVITNKERFYLISLSVASVLVVFNFVLVDRLYIFWFDSIQSKGIANFTGFESLGLSTIIYESGFLNKENARTLGISLFLLFLALSLLTAIFDRSRSTLFIIPLIAMFFPYLHYLDFAITLPFIIYFAFYQSNLRFLVPASIILLYLPRPTDGFVKNLLSFVIVLVFLAFDFARYKRLQTVLTGTVFSTILLISNYWIVALTKDAYQLSLLTVLRVWLVVICILIGAIITDKKSKINYFFGLLKLHFKEFKK